MNHPDEDTLPFASGHPHGDFLNGEASQFYADHEPQYPVTKSTRRMYVKIVNGTLNYSRNLRRTNPEEDVFISLADIVEDLIARTDIIEKTRYTYRGALLWWIKNQPEINTPYGMYAFNMLKGMERKKGRTATRKPQSIPEEDFNLLRVELYRRASEFGSEWAARTGAWIEAAYITGARPVEWLNASWDTPEKKNLKIKTAKVHLTDPAFMRDKNSPEPDSIRMPELDELYSDDGDFYGIMEGVESSVFEAMENDRIYRLIPVETDDHRAVIDLHMRMLEEAMQGESDPDKRQIFFERYYKSSYMSISRACTKIWGGKKQYSLQVMRKQFSANMKALYGSTVAAELLGHSRSDSPSAASYGKANQAHKRFKGQSVQPSRWVPVAGLIPKRSDSE